MTNARASLSDKPGQRNIDLPSFVIIGNTETPLFLPFGSKSGQRLCFPPSEKTWFTDEPENAHLRTVTHVSPCKSSSSSIPPIREAEDQC